MNTTRREWLAAAGGFAFAASAQANEGVFHATSINHMSLTVPDVAAAADFYGKLLGSRVIQDMGERGQMRGLQRNYLALFKGDEAGLNHFSPGVDGLDEPGAGAILKKHGYEPFNRTPTIWACLDPDGTQNHLSETMRREDEVAAALEKDPNPDSILRGIDVNHIALRVSDVGRSVDWYQKLLGLPLISQGANTAFLGLGDNFLALFKSDNPGGAAHFCFSVDDYEPEKVIAKLAKHDIKARREQDRVYFPDVNGLTVQVSEEGHQP